MKFPIETPRKQVNWDPKGWYFLLGRPSSCLHLLRARASVSGSTLAPGSVCPEAGKCAWEPQRGWEEGGGSVGSKPR